MLDNDIHADVDAAAALTMLHNLQDRGGVNLLAVMVNTPGRWGAPCVDAINTWNGRSDIPIGALKPVDNSLAWKDYCQAVAHKFPNDLQDGARAPDAPRLYRQVLRRQPDHTVTVVSIGFLTNLRNLLGSRQGRRLARDKIRRLVVMGGTYPAGAEYNFQQAPRAAARVTRRWPGRVVYTGFELGLHILTQPTADGGPLERAYQLGLAEGGARSSWDQTAVLYAAFPSMFREVAGANRVDPVTGANRWLPGHGEQRFLRLRLDRVFAAGAIQKLMQPGP
jgi:inosine-uridine nucleoside N-ribohydrolase